MKKFIRTKDDVYDTENLIYRTIKDNKVYQVGWDVEKPTFEADILAEADTPEELIDAYVFVSKSGETHYVYFKSFDMGVCLGSRIENDETFKNHLLENGNVYGAIWTDKGLIYVIKLNEKGDSELI